ncbi:MAG TPA: YdeI/OmpD-associated family protein [Bdellovibrio sp.]|uniref:YdeI/OmpD-associated family protein n=1 Tax=Bdellovibrio sp. TaxID=28201 RepID=UPI002EE1FFD1
MAKAGTKLSFQAKLENWAEGMDYCAIAVPAKITQALGTKKAVLVMASLNGCEPFQVSLFPAGEGKHYIRVRAKVRKQADLHEGDKVKVQITVQDRADVDLPPDLVAALKTEGALKEFNALTPGKKNYAVRKINDVVKPETRKKRIAEAVELALQEAERKADRKK